MAIERLFVYGTLLYKDTVENIGNGHVKVLNLTPACAEGKLFDGGRFPIVIDKREGRKTRPPYIVHGGLYLLDINEEGWKNIDAYEGCSRQRMLKNLPSDLYHRHEVYVREIYCQSIEKFIDMDYITGKQIKSWIYYGNMQHEFINHICMKLRRKNGIVWKTYFNVFS